MSKKIKIGDYVIMNDADKPCTRLIAQIIELPEGKDFARGQYICKKVNIREPCGRLSDVTLISDFGVEMAFSSDMVSTEQVRPSVATYRDGEPRDWQPGDENPYQKLFKAKR